MPCLRTEYIYLYRLRTNEHDFQPENERTFSFSFSFLFLSFLFTYRLMRADLIVQWWALLIQLQSIGGYWEKGDCFSFLDPSVCFYCQVWRWNTASSDWCLAPGTMEQAHSTPRSRQSIRPILKHLADACRRVVKGSSQIFRYNLFKQFKYCIFDTQGHAFNLIINPIKFNQVLQTMTLIMLWQIIYYTPQPRMGSGPVESSRGDFKHNCLAVTEKLAAVVEQRSQW